MHLPLLSVVWFIAFHHSAIEPGWVMLSNIIILPVSALITVWLMMYHQKLQVALAVLLLLGSPLMVHPIFNVILLLSAASLVIRSVYLWASGQSR